MDRSELLAKVEAYSLNGNKEDFYILQENITSKTLKFSPAIKTVSKAMKNKNLAKLFAKELSLIHQDSHFIGSPQQIDYLRNIIQTNI